MNRPRFSRLRRRSPRTAPPFPYLSESEPAWLELGHAELRVRRDGGDVAWSAALPDATQTLAGREWAAPDLAALDHEGDGEGDEEVLLGRS